MIVKFASTAFAGLALSATAALAEDVEKTQPAEGIIDVGSVQAGSSPNDEFQNLFASWEALDEGGVVGKDGSIAPVAPEPVVSVPSLMPVEGARMSSGYGMRDHPVLRRRKNHNGIDLAVGRGTPVYATADGMIGKAQYWGSYGNYVQIEHGGELQTRYAHLSSYTVEAGSEVRKGDLIGYVGSTGRSTGPHLHYEVRVEGQPVDPRPYMLTNLASLVEDETGGKGGPE